MVHSHSNAHVFNQGALTAFSRCFSSRPSLDVSKACQQDNKKNRETVIAHVPPRHSICLFWLLSFRFGFYLGCQESLSARQQEEQRDSDCACTAKALHLPFLAPQLQGQILPWMSAKPVSETTRSTQRHRLYRQGTGVVATRTSSSANTL